MYDINVKRLSLSKIISDICKRPIQSWFSSIFNNTNLSNNLPMNEQLLTIKDTRVVNCSTLAKGEIVIPEGVSEISNDAFLGCKFLTSIIIPNGVKYIGDYAFSGCNSLTSIVLPESTLEIGTGSFLNCESLSTIIIPKNLYVIGEFAFHQCKSLSLIEIPENARIYPSTFDENTEIKTTPSSFPKMGPWEMSYSEYKQLLFKVAAKK